ncbi:hypothetical protein PMIT1313_01893 [Prochlorococcus marinus str. MIT 1313]|nr:hypothetical protein PMIT1313_01893 [Prochlorococcus marinus str. MIT 1313]KZR71481.1 hypothetical protein PMIT1318_02633 [Prochlorococcus marinus str. MIT 1318]
MTLLQFLPRDQDKLEQMKQEAIDWWSNFPEIR